MTNYNEPNEAEMDKQEIEWFENKNDGGVDGFPGWIRARADDLERLIGSARRDKFSPAETEYLKKSLGSIASEISTMISKVERYEKARARQVDRSLGLKK